MPAHRFQAARASFHACGRGARLDASVRLDDLVRALLMTNGLTNAIEIGLERVNRNDERALQTFEFAGPTGQFAIVRRAWQEVALLENFDRLPLSA